MGGGLVTVVETPLFVRQAEALWCEEERQEFIGYIASDPERGDVIPGTGGVRKLRWRRPGSGKRGGVRVVYFYYRPTVPLYLLMVYGKSRKEDLTPDEKRAVRDLTAVLKSSPKKGW